MADSSINSKNALMPIFVEVTRTYEKVEQSYLLLERYWQEEQQRPAANGQKQPETLLNKQKRVERLLELIGAVKESASNVFKKIPQAHIHGASMLSTDPVEGNEEQIAHVFKDAWVAYLELRRVLLELTRAYLDEENWAEARNVVSLLLHGNNDKQSELYSEIHTCLCTSYYRPAQLACEKQDWKKAAELLEELLKLDDSCADARDLLCEAYYRLTDISFQEDNLKDAVCYLIHLRALNPNYRNSADWSRRNPYLFWRIGLLRQISGFFTWPKEYPLLDMYTCLAISPDGKRLAVGSSYGSILLCDAITGLFFRKLLKHDGEICSIAFSPDGALLASGGTDGYVRLWNVKTGEEQKAAKHHDAIEEVVFLHGTSYLASRSTSKGLERQIQLWRIRDLFLLTERNASCIALYPEEGREQLLAWGFQNGTIQVETTGRTAKKYRYRHTAKVEEMSFSPDYRYLCSASDDDTIIVWDVKARTQCALYRGYIMAFAPDGHTLASACKDGSLNLWKVGEEYPHATLSLPPELSGKAVSKMFFSPDGNFWILVCGNRILIVDMLAVPQEISAELSLPPVPPGDEKHPDCVITSVVMMPDGSRLFALDAEGTGIVLEP